MTDAVSINGARGEVEIVVDGAPYRLCLTLGALAEIETSMGCLSIEDLEGRLKSVSAADIMRIVEALLRGGGTSEAAAAFAARTLGAVGAARAVMKAFGAVRGNE